jgi:hypothetical protein
MNHPKPNITIPVDLTNPGQFFACCGLLELADRLWPGAEGWFEGKTFSIASECVTSNLDALFNAVASAAIEQIDKQDNAASAIMYRLDTISILLDWWRDEASGGQRLKTWAGRQSGPQIFRLMAAKVADLVAIDSQSPFDFSAAVYDVADGKAKKKTISPFYFDSRRAGTSLDAGFSADEQQMSVSEYPVVEAFAMIGMQRFRPRSDEVTSPRSFLYTAWFDRLPAIIAQGIVCGAIIMPSCRTYRFAKPSRGGEYASMFTRAMRERSSNV